MMALSSHQILPIIMPTLQRKQMFAFLDGDFSLCASRFALADVLKVFRFKFHIRGSAHTAMLFTAG